MLHELLAWRRDVREFRSDRVDAAIIVDAAFQFGTMPPQQAIHRPRAHREQEPLHFVADFEVHPPCNARVTDGSEKGRTWPERSGMRHRENPYSIDLFSS